MLLDSLWCTVRRNFCGSVLNNTIASAKNYVTRSVQIRIQKGGGAYVPFVPFPGSAFGGGGGGGGK